VASEDLRGVVEQIQQTIESEIELPEGYRIEYGGQFESEARATRRLLILGALAIVGIIVLLTTALKSSADALIVTCNLPLALVGGVVGLYAGGGVLSVASLIGFITLFGIAVRNGIMLLAHIRRLMAEEGVGDLRQAVLRGSSERLAPILMTALSTGIALLPVGLGLGKTGSEIHAPLALVVLFGLLSSTLLNMLVVPTVFWRLHRTAQ
jgi:Cu/Ag efflux pump CusA